MKRFFDNLMSVIFGFIGSMASLYVALFQVSIAFTMLLIPAGVIFGSIPHWVLKAEVGVIVAYCIIKIIVWNR